MFQAPVDTTARIPPLTIENPPTKELYSWEAVGTVTPVSDELEFLQTSENQDYIPIVVPHNKGRRGEWLIRIVFSTDYMMNGDCTAIITTDSFKRDLCSNEDETFEECLAREDVNGKFVIAAGSRGQWQNTFILQTVLSSRAAANAAEERVGVYKLWLFKREQYFLPMEEEIILPYHVKVTLSQVEEEEDPLNCDSIPLPDDLGTASGYFDEALKTIHMHQQVAMNRTTGVQKTIYKPSVKSLLRIYVAHPTESILTTVWIRDGGNKRLIAQSFEDNTQTQVEPSGIVLVLQPDDIYEIWFTESNIISFGNELDENELTPFCDSFMCRLEVIPVTDEPSDGPFKSEKPTIPFENILEEPWEISFGGDYTASVEHGWVQEEIGSYPFEVKVPSSFSITVRRDFIIGDVMVALYPKKEDGDVLQDDEIIVSNCGLDGSMLDTTLHPGSYILSLQTGPTQQKEGLAEDFPENYDGIPTNYRYSVTLEMAPLDVEVSCPVARPLPSNIDVTDPLKSGFVHIFERFLIPEEATHTLTFTPKEESVLHVVAESRLPVDMRVSSGDVVESPKDGEGRDPFLLVNLKAETEYSITFNFEKTDTLCQDFVMQFSVAPAFSSNTAEPDDECNSIPSNELIDVALPMPYTLIGDYSTNVRDLRTSVRTTPFNFQVDEETEFKSVVHYSFKHGSVNILLCSCAGPLPFENCDECSTHRPKSTFNGDELRGIINPGKYQLKIIEATAAPLCQRYRLEIYMDKVYRPGKAAAEGHNCMHQFLSKNLNIPGQIVNDQLHALGEVRVDSRHFQDATQFTVTQNVLLRLWLPPSYHIDEISVVIVISKRNPDGTRIDNVPDLTYNEGEAVAVPLVEGTYFVLLKYEAVQEIGDDSLRRMPRRAVCSSNSFEISIVPIDVIKAEELGTEPCIVTQPFPTTPESHGHTGEDGHLSARKLSLVPEDGGAYEGITQEINWSFGDKGGRMEFDVYSTFETSSIHFHVAKKSTAGYEYFYPQRYLDRDYLYVTVGPGEYSFLFTTSSVDGVDNLFKCTKYTLHLSIEDFSITIAPTPVPIGETEAPATPQPVEMGNNCPEQGEFPYNLQTHSTQQRTLFVGERYNFLTADPLPEYSLRNSVDGFIRVWTHTHNTEVDIDLRLKNDGQVMATKSTKGTHVETLSYDIPASEEMYDIGVLISEESRTTDYSSLRDCDEWAEQTTFDFAIGIMTSEQIEEYTRCPDLTKEQMEVPKARYEIGTDFQDVRINSFVTMQPGNEEVEPELVISDNMESADITIVVRYDFTLLNLHIELYDPTLDERVPIAHADGELDIEGEYTASSYLTVPNLKPGTYKLYFSNPDNMPSFLVTNVLSGIPFCLPYEFDLRATINGGMRPQYQITSIDPISHDSLSATMPLEVRIAFSSAVAKELSDQDGDAVKVTKRSTGEALSIRQMNYEDDIVAIYTFANLGKYYPLEWDTQYDMVIKASSFKSADGSEFKIGFPIEQANGDLTFKTDVGGCSDSNYCFWGGQCGYEVVGCAKCLNDLLPKDGWCPAKDEVTPIPSSSPIKFVTPKPTPQPTPAPTPRPTAKEHTLRPTSRPTHPPTDKPTEKPNVTPKPTPKPTNGATSPPPSGGGGGGGGGSGTTVVIVLLLIALALALAYVAHSKGWISTNRHRNPYGPAPLDGEDGDEFETEITGSVSDGEERPEV
eukprot:TRINITY_DN531_c0_g1_i1.p1 TRINITY_DN531_c0_g1~~TRINITY_DN531_c0_g1_i1.p1  ORF type:complete len:1858 (+),score=417.46 TRINITY_DN531_c0_g1_i1:525-5576(+)